MHAAFLPQPGLIFTIASFVAMLGVLVTVHEFGHYIAGRAFGVRADVFSIGFGKELLGVTDRRGCRWKVSALPLGGYVKFAGDMNAASMPSPEVAAMSLEERAVTLNAQPLWARAVIIAAGPAINFAFAIAIFAVLFATLGRSVVPPVVAGVQPGSAAAAAGIHAGDRFVSIDGTPVERFDDLARVVAINTGHAVLASVKRADQTLHLVITPKVMQERDEFGNPYTVGRLGIAFAGKAERERMGPLRAIAVATKQTFDLVPVMAKGIWQVIAGERRFSELRGPVGMAQVVGQQASLGWQSFVPFVALISINLGFINLLPIPVLDGGHLAMYALEGVRRRPLGKRAQELAFMSGFALLLTFMFLKTVNDLGSFGLWRHLAGLIG